MDSAHATSGEEDPGEWATKTNRECRRMMVVQWKREDLADEDAVAAGSVEASEVAAAADSVAGSEEALEAEEVIAADSEEAEEVIAVAVVDAAEVAHAAVVVVELPTSQMPAKALHKRREMNHIFTIQTSSD